MFEKGLLKAKRILVIHGERVVQDRGAHLRGPGAEDLLQWTDAQWEAQRAARSKA